MQPAPPPNGPTAPETGGDPPRVVVAAVNPVQLPDWMQSSQVEHQPTGWNRLRFFSARHNGALLLALGLVLALLMVLGGAMLVGRVADGIRSGAAAAAPSASPTRPPAGVDDPRDLFAGTPAASFAPAEQAVVLPAAAPTGPFSTAEVGAALKLVRQALIESRLDLSMLMGDPEPFLARLAPDSRRQLRPHFADASFLRFATRFASPSNWKNDFRAQGRISYRAIEDDGVRLLEVTTEFVWAYPFRVDVRAPAGAGVVAIRDRVVWQVPHPDDVPVSARGLWVASATVTTWNADCAELSDGWVREQTWMAGQHRERLPAGEPGTIFDLDAPAPSTTRC